MVAKTIIQACIQYDKGGTLKIICEDRDASLAFENEFNRRFSVEEDVLDDSFEYKAEPIEDIIRSEQQLASYN
jgi:hypothetical protein